MIRFFDPDDIAAALDFPSLIEALRNGFTRQVLVPPRMHLDYANPQDDCENTLLLMPAVAAGRSLGTKVVTVAPANARHDLPSIQGLYLLMDANTGQPQALMETKTLTNWRTAAASALAASYLAAPGAETLLMVGTGALAGYLPLAHLAVRPLKRLLVWGRSPEKALAIAENLSPHFDSAEAVDDLGAAAEQADIISSATMTTEPLIPGARLRPGAHVDLVGAYRPEMREADDAAISRSRIFIDTEMALREAGELKIPLDQGTITRDDIQGDLFGLCQDTTRGRRTPDEITLFKSVGHALEDLVAAELVVGQH